MQDELADMMTRNMHLGRPPAEISNPPTPQVAPQAAPITYISQHYHHSAHIAPAVEEEAQASTILKSVGVNADALLPSQLQLFKNADNEQKERLVELWRIAPPAHGNQVTRNQIYTNWPPTSMEAEETAARERWEKQEQEKLRNLSVLPSQEKRDAAEPYMETGYEYAMRMEMEANEQNQRPATDPVHNREREWWQMGDQERMENQYGMLQAYGAAGMYGFCGIVDKDRMVL